MNAEELEIARRLVACKGWVWLPGMLTVRDDAQPLRLEFVDEPGWGMTQTVENNRHVFSLASRLPDLSDDLTRLGVLAVVRRAWGDKTASVRAVDCYPLSAMWTWIAGQPGVRRVGHERTELGALLAALEAAP